jgi:hypothetical protein
MNERTFTWAKVLLGVAVVNLLFLFSELALNVFGVALR